MSSARGVFIAGTDTGVGKTEVARAVLQLFASRGDKPRALKPVETGCAPDSPEDALALRKACGAPNDALPLDEVCPYRFRMPAAPLVAAEAEGRAIDPKKILQCVQSALGAGQPLVVEAAGGLLVPLWREGAKLVTNLDLAEQLGFPVLLVGRAGLGTINHCALSAMALLQRKIPLLGIVLNRVADHSDPTLETNAQMIEGLSSVTVVGPGPFQADAKERANKLQALISSFFIA